MQTFKKQWMSVFNSIGICWGSDTSGILKAPQVYPTSSQNFEPIVYNIAC